MFWNIGDDWWCSTSAQKRLTGSVQLDIINFLHHVVIWSTILSWISHAIPGWGERKGKLIPLKAQSGAAPRTILMWITQPAPHWFSPRSNSFLMFRSFQFNDGVIKFGLMIIYGRRKVESEKRSKRKPRKIKTSELKLMRKPWEWLNNKTCFMPDLLTVLIVMERISIYKPMDDVMEN